MKNSIVFLAAYFMANLFFISCNKKKIIIRSTFSNGQPKETIELIDPISQDSIGILKEYYENGVLHVIGKSKNNKRQGEWIGYFPNRRIRWKSVFKDDIENGETTWYDKDGYWHKFESKNGIMDGRFTEYFYDWFDSVNCYIKGFYINGIKQGLWTKTDTFGVLLVEMTYNNGKAIGYFTNRYKNGKLKLRGEIDEKGDMKNFTFYDEYGNIKKKKEYILRKI